MQELKFSVAMSVYKNDKPEWFKRAIDSILDQTLVPNEIVLIVDGEVGEELAEIISQCKKNEVFKVIEFEENRGHGEARRAGVENSSYNLIAIMDADDVSLPQRFEKQIQVFKNDPSVAVVGGNISEFEGKEENVIAYRNVPQTDEQIKNYLKKRCPFNQVSVMMRKDIVQSVGGYLDWYCNEDYYLWVRLANNNSKFANIDEVLVNVRVGKEMYGRRGGWKYFKSERRLQKLMLKSGIIGFFTYITNVTKRLILQVLMPTKIRGWVFKRFARTQK